MVAAAFIVTALLAFRGSIYIHVGRGFVFVVAPSVGVVVVLFLTFGIR